MDTVLLGRIGRPHGIKGEVRVDYHAESPELLNGNIFLREASGALRPVRVATWRAQSDHMLIRLEGVNDRTAAEALRNQELLISEADLPEPNDDEVYLNDIIGLQVICAGQPIGVIDHVLFPAGQELWSILGTDGAEILFPAVPEFVENIDLTAGTVNIAPPLGLLELYASEGKG